MTRLTEKDREALRKQFPFSAKAGIEGGKLVVESMLVNHSVAPAWVFNVLWEYGPDGQIRRAGSDGYACVVSSELRIARMPYPYPATMKIGAAIVPHLTELAVGMSRRERLTFPVPVDEYSCYQPRRQDSPVESVQADHVVVMYGLIAGGEATSFAQDSTTGAQRLIDGTLMDRFVVVQAEPIKLAVEVNRRKDALWRF